MEVWIVGRMTRMTDSRMTIHEWEMRGFYDTRREAVKACIDENYFVSGVQMNKDIREVLPSDSERYFPLLASIEGSTERMEEFNGR